VRIQLQQLAWRHLAGREARGVVGLEPAVHRIAIVPAGERMRRAAVAHEQNPHPKTSRRVNSVNDVVIAPTAHAPSSRMQNVIVMPSYGGAWPV
jgi:hypothetical protein